MKNNKSLAFLALVFVALFSYWTVEQIKFFREKDLNRSFENLPDTSSTFTQKADDDNESGQEPKVTTEENKTSASVWTATDYKEGDIGRGSYTVKSGDTLWEISEAVYGDGTQWVKILQVNSSQIGYLPSGQQALIFPGQVLVIP